MEKEILGYIQMLFNFSAIVAAGWIYKAYVTNLRSSLALKDEQIKAVEKICNFGKKNHKN